MTRTKGLLAVIAALVLIAGVGIWGAVGILNQIQQGRRAAAQVTCAVLSGVTQGGRDVLTASAKGPDTPFARKLEQLGYPPLKVRRVQAEKAGDAYVASIAVSVARVAGRRRVDLVKRDGTIDCHAFLELARTSRN